MNISRYIFGTIYLLGAVANTVLLLVNGADSYETFTSNTFWPWYNDAWMTVAVPNMTLIVVLLIIFEVSLGLLFLLKRKYMRIALALGILFCLASMPTMIQAIFTNLPLVLIQAFLLWRESRLKKQ